MKVCKCWILMLFLMLTSSVSVATWSDDFCDIDRSCADLSNNFTQPYCSQDKNGNRCTRLALTNNLSIQMDNINNLEMGGVVKNYCFSLLWDSSSWRIYYSKPSNLNPDTWDWQQTFDSHQSIFVYALCSSFKDQEGKTPFLTGNANLEWVFKDKDIVNVLKLKQRLSWKDKCSLQDDPSLQDCDMSMYATEIYSTIMSDIFKIQYAQVLNLDKSEDFDVAQKIEDFMSWYFGYQEKYTDLKNKFPQTVNVLKSNQKYYKTVLDSVKIINNSELVSLAENSNCSASSDKEKIEWLNFIACALHSSQGNGLALSPSFETMIHNEMLSYSIFNNYLHYWMDAKVSDMTRRWQNNETIEEYKSKAVDFQWYSDLQIKATKWTLRTFEDFNMTYPLHIWLLMYQEKMKEFRDKKLSPIVTIFYSLSEKLQNVQLPN